MNVLVMTMNATERARRSDSLYYDTQVTNRRALCDMIAHLESDLAESKAENAKLRELVRDYDKVLDDAVYVWGTVADFLGYGRKYDALHDRMMELGIEVDE